MFCPNCGNQVPDNSLFCASCGTSLQMNNSFEAPVNLEHQNDHSFAAVLRRALCSGKFLAMCILVTVAAVLSFASGSVSIDNAGMSTTTTIDVWSVLVSVAMWITYANAKSSEPVMKVGGLKFNAVLAKITFVLNWIAAGLLVVSGAIICAVGPTFDSLLSEEGMMEELYLEIAPVFEEYGFGEMLGDITSELISIFLIAFGVGFLIAGIVMILFNIFYYGKVKTFANNLHISYITNKVTNLRFSTISKWFMVMGILGAIGSLSTFMVSPVAAVAAISGPAATIVASVWVNELEKATAENPQTPEIQQF